MPYCCQCGQTVESRDVYCASCGARQPAASSYASDPLSGISGKNASLLCYIPVLGWLAAIVVLASKRFRGDRKVRFNAFQGLYLFVAWLIVDWVVDPMFNFPSFGPPLHKIFPVLLKAAIFGAWIFMIIKASHDEIFKLPVLGELAEKSVSEQR
jgi:uncharacterized membrane protein